MVFHGDDINDLTLADLTDLMTLFQHVAGSAGLRFIVACFIFN